MNRAPLRLVDEDLDLLEEFLAEALSGVPVAYTKVPRRSMARDPLAAKGSKTGQAGVDFEQAFLTGANLLGLDYAAQTGSALWDFKPTGKGWDKVIRSKDVNIKVANTKWMFQDSIVKRMLPWSAQLFNKYGPAVFAGPQYTEKVAARLRKQGRKIPVNPSLVAAHEKRIQLYLRSVVKIQNYLFMSPKTRKIQKEIVSAARAGFGLGYDRSKGIPRDLDDKKRHRLTAILEKLNKLYRAKNFHTYKFPKNFDVKLHIFDKSNVLNPRNGVKGIDIEVDGKPVAMATNNPGKKEHRLAGVIRILFTGYGSDGKPPKQGFDHGPAKIHPAKVSKARPWLDFDPTNPKDVLNTEPTQATVGDVLLPHNTPEGTFGRAITYLSRELKDTHGKPVIELTSGRNYLRIGVFSFQGSKGLNMRRMFPDLSTSHVSSFKFTKPKGVVFSDHELASQLPWVGSKQTFDDLFTSRFRAYKKFRREIKDGEVTEAKKEEEKPKKNWERFPAEGGFAITNKDTLLATLENYISDVLKAIGTKAREAMAGSEEEKKEAKVGDLFYVVTNKAFMQDVRRLNKAYEGGKIDGPHYATKTVKLFREAKKSGRSGFFQVPEDVLIQFNVSKRGDQIRNVEVFDKDTKKLFMVAEHNGGAIEFRMPRSEKEARKAKFRNRSLRQRVIALGALRKTKRERRRNPKTRIDPITGKPYTTKAVAQLAKSIPSDKILSKMAKGLAAPWVKAKTKAEFAAEAAQRKARVNALRTVVQQARETVKQHKKGANALSKRAGQLARSAEAKTTTPEGARAAADKAEEAARDARHLFDLAKTMMKVIRDNAEKITGLSWKADRLSRVKSLIKDKADATSPAVIEAFKNHADALKAMNLLVSKTLKGDMEIIERYATKAEGYAKQARSSADKKIKTRTTRDIKKVNKDVATTFAKASESLDLEAIRSYLRETVLNVDRR